MNDLSDITVNQEGRKFYCFTCGAKLKEAPLGFLRCDECNLFYFSTIVDGNQTLTNVNTKKKGSQPKLKHVLWEDTDKDIPKSITDINGQVALSMCKVCGGAEGSLPTNCPGRELTYEESELICNGELDF